MDKTTNIQTILVKNPMVPGMQWSFEKPDLEYRSPAEIISTLIDSGEIRGSKGEWKVSCKGELLESDDPISRQIDLGETETHLHIHPIVAGAFQHA